MPQRWMEEGVNAPACPCAEEDEWRERRERDKDGRGEERGAQDGPAQAGEREGRREEQGQKRVRSENRSRDPKKGVD